MGNIEKFVRDWFFSIRNTALLERCIIIMKSALKYWSTIRSYLLGNIYQVLCVTDPAPDKKKEILGHIMSR